MGNGDGRLAERGIGFGIAVKTRHHFGAHIENARINAGRIAGPPFGINRRQKLLHKILISRPVIQPGDIGKACVLPAKLVQMRGFAENFRHCVGRCASHLVGLHGRCHIFQKQNELLRGRAHFSVKMRRTTHRA